MWSNRTVCLVKYCVEWCERPKANVSHLSTIQKLCTIATVVLLRHCDWPVHFRAQFISLAHTVVAYVVFTPSWQLLLCFSFGHLTFAFSLTNTALIFFNYNSPSSKLHYRSRALKAMFKTQDWPFSLRTVFAGDGWPGAISELAPKLTCALTWVLQCAALINAHWPEQCKHQREHQ